MKLETHKTIISIRCLIFENKLISRILQGKIRILKSKWVLHEKSNTILENNDPKKDLYILLDFWRQVQIFREWSIKFGSDRKFNEISEISDPRHSYFDISFNFLRNISFVHFKSKIWILKLSSRPDEKLLRCSKSVRQKISILSSIFQAKWILPIDGVKHWIFGPNTGRVKNLMMRRCKSTTKKQILTFSSIFQVRSILLIWWVRRIWGRNLGQVKNLMRYIKSANQKPLFR